LRQWPPATGQACLSQEVRNDEVLSETVRLFQSVDFRGLAYLEMKKDERSGRYFIVEPNIGRPTGRAASAEAGGVELLYTMYCDAVGLPLPEARTQQYRNVKWIHFLRDAQAALFYFRRRELTIREWRRSIEGPRVNALLSWKDPLPFVTALYRALPEAIAVRIRG
jgi:predicted ATP-grasp superfamily ATP-dependent carboligase